MLITFITSEADFKHFTVNCLFYDYVIRNALAQQRDADETERRNNVS